jgi:hypothetical protein
MGKLTAIPESVRRQMWALTGVVWLALLGRSAGAEPPRLTLDWHKTGAISRAAVSIQVCPEPPLLKGRPLHDKLFALLHQLDADYARLQPWFPYPRISVAELKPPAVGRTYWDFKRLDEMTADFMQAVGSRPVIVNFGAFPLWMFKDTDSFQLPVGTDEIAWAYATGTEFRDPSLEEAADYQARLASWYMAGGFKDEDGRWHASGHHYKFAYWEIGNEPDLEHQLSPQQYTRFYDKVVEKIRALAPEMKFAGPAVSNPDSNVEFLDYFLNAAHHQPGIGIDMLTYHFYTLPDRDETLADMQHTIFEKVDALLAQARFVNVLRAKSYPHAKVAIDELGSMLTDPTAPRLTAPIPAAYWNLSAAMWAYAYGNLAALDVDVVSGAELIDYPGQVASASLVDWETGQPNARFLVLKLLRDNFQPGDALVTPNWQTQAIPGVREIYAQGFVAPSGTRKLLLVNKRDRAVDVDVAEAAGGRQSTVDQSTVGEPATQALTSNAVHLGGFAVAVITFPREASP